MSKNKSITFQGKKPDEEVLLYMRRHWITFIVPFLFTMAVFILPLVIAYIVLVKDPIIKLSGDIIWTSALIWFLLGLFFLTYNFLDWYLDTFIVTNKRIIDINQNGLFNRVVGETALDNVQDVIYEIKGIVATIFNHGSVTIHTGGPTGDIKFEDIEKPQETQRFLLAEVEKYKNENTEKFATPEDLLNMMMSHEKDRVLRMNETLENSSKPEIEAHSKTLPYDKKLPDND